MQAAGKQTHQKALGKLFEPRNIKGQANTATFIPNNQIRQIGSIMNYLLLSM